MNLRMMPSVIRVPINIKHMVRKRFPKQKVFIRCLSLLPNSNTMFDNCKINSENLMLLRKFDN